MVREGREGGAVLGPRRDIQAGCPLEARGKPVGQLGIDQVFTAVLAGRQLFGVPIAAVVVNKVGERLVFVGEVE